MKRVEGRETRGRERDVPCKLGGRTRTDETGWMGRVGAEPGWWEDAQGLLGIVPSMYLGGGGGGVFSGYYLGIAVIT